MKKQILLKLLSIECIRFFTILLVHCSFASAQENLVPNGSFENYQTCPIGIGNFNCSNWFSATITTPDYYCPCAGLNGSGVPANAYGNQLPAEGQSYVGINLNADDGYREYVAVKLTHALIGGAIYSLKFFISSSELTNYGSNNMQAYFAVDTAGMASTVGAGGTPILLSNSNVVGGDDILFDTIHWQKIELIYNATGGEQFLLLGNFKPQEETLFGTNNGQSIDSYYYIDNVFVREIFPVSNIPNVFTPNNDQVNDFFAIDGPPTFHLDILDRWGNIIYHSSTIAAWDGTCRGKECDNGVYFYKYRYEDENEEEKQQVGFVELIR